MEFRFTKDFVSSNFSFHWTRVLKNDEYSAENDVEILLFGIFPYHAIKHHSFPPTRAGRRVDKKIKIK